MGLPLWDVPWPRLRHSVRSACNEMSALNYCKYVGLTFPTALQLRMQVHDSRSTLRLSTVSNAATFQSQAGPQAEQRRAQRTPPQVSYEKETVAPHCLTACRKGVADEELAKKEAERGRKRKADDDEILGGARKRSRSYSSTSVSTISTSRSRSQSPRHTKLAHDERKLGFRSKLPGSSPHRRTARSSSHSALSYRSRSFGRNISEHRGERSGTLHGRRPVSSDRRRENMPLNGTRKRRRTSSTSSRSYSSDYSNGQRRRNRSHDGDRNTRRRRSSVSPDTRGRDRSLPRNNGKRRTMSRGDSMDRGRIARGRQSMTPRSPPPAEKVDGRGSGAQEGVENRPPQIQAPRKERSLSPFSKRLALTQAMNLGHR